MECSSSLGSFFCPKRAGKDWCTNKAFVSGTLPTKKRLIFSSNENKKSPSLGHA
jgi:hypothetical protein